MKKITLMLVAMLAAFAANAWTVKFTNPDNWTTVAAYCFNGAGEVLGKWPGTVMTKGDDGLWTVTCDAGEPQNIIFNNNNNGSQTSNLDFVAGATYNKNGVEGAKLNEYTIYFDNSVKNWSNVYVYVWGPELNGKWPGKELSKNAKGLYEWTIEAASEPSFDGMIFTNNAGSQTAQFVYKAGTTYDFNGVKGAAMETYTVYFDNKAGWDKVYVYTWEPEVATYPGIELTKGKDGLYAWNYESTVEPSFGGLQFNNGEKDAAELKTNDLTYEVGATYSNGEAEIVLPEHLYVIGNVNGASWGSDNTIELEKTETGFEGSFTIGNDLDSGYGYFAFTEVSSASWDDLNGKGLRWGAPSNDYVLTGGETVTLKQQDDDAAFKVEADSTVRVSINWATKVMTVEVSTGVATIEAANGEAVYFNMQGVRVANPENGLFIRVQNGKAVKVVK